MNDDSINVGFVVDDRYIKFLSVTMISILKNTDKAITFHIINDGSITQESMDGINALQSLKMFSIKYYAQTKVLHHEIRSDTRQDITAVTNHRLMLAEILTDLDKIIFMDADLIIKQDLSELYNLEISDYYIAACLTPNDPFMIEYKRSLDIPENYYYCNTGVMLVNLKKWREDTITEKLLDAEIKYRDTYKFYDQCVLNIVLYKKLYYLDQKWNVRPGIWELEEYKNIFENPAIIHWASKIKPWHCRFITYAHHYYNYAKLSPFYRLIKREIKYRLEFELLVKSIIKYIIPNKIWYIAKRLIRGKIGKNDKKSTV